SIQSISSGRALPSKPQFLYICDNFGVTPAEFFSTDETEIIKQKELLNQTKNLKAEDLDLLIQFAKRLDK
ncbi:MAG: transcriptional regulator, partial [Eubacterium sp.]|nr:transcriptional regulator [Eubacterium sp.]